jgi:1,4-dihydroxy-2-naphthoate octaprenyltransferase
MRIGQLIGRFLALVEMRTKVVSISTFTIASLFALRSKGSLDPAALGLGFASVLLVDMGTTAFNSFFDWWRGVDHASTNRESDKVILTQGVPALAVFFLAASLYALAALIGIVLAFKVGFWIVPAGGLCLAAGFFYNGGPMPISRTPFGEFVSGAFLGSALFLIVFRVLGGDWNTAALLASIPGALMISSILAVNNACDIEGDKASGRRTLAVRLGRSRASILVYFLAGAGIAATAALSVSGPLPRLGLAAAAASFALALPVFRGMRSRGYSHSTKGPSMSSIIRIFSIWSLCLAASIALSP